MVLYLKHKCSIVGNALYKVRFNALYTLLPAVRNFKTEL